MNRRTYLGVAAAGVMGAVAGCTGGAGSEYPPYPDSESTELSGEGVGASESFELALDGPTLVDITHEGSDNFTVTLDPADSVENESAADGSDEMDDADETNETATDDAEEMADGGNETSTNGTNEMSTTGTNGTNETSTNGTNETSTNGTNEMSTNDTAETTDTDTEPEVARPVATVATAVGPYDGRSLQSVDPGSYVLNVREADAEWTATVYDLPAYDDGVGLTLPLERSGEQYDVIGPINFGDQESTEFSFSVTGQGVHRVFLTDREGDDSLTVTNVNGDADETVTQRISGVGYIEVLSFGSWTFGLST